MMTIKIVIGIECSMAHGKWLAEIVRRELRRYTQIRSCKTPRAIKTETWANTSAMVYPQGRDLGLKVGC